VGSFHWLIVIPYYFFAALAALLLLTVIARLTRARVPANALVLAAVSLSLAVLVAPLLTGWTTLAQYTGRPLLLIVVGSFALAGLDVILQQWLPLPLDKELDAL